MRKIKKSFVVLLYFVKVLGPDAKLLEIGSMSLGNDLDLADRNKNGRKLLGWIRNKYYVYGK